MKYLLFPIIVLFLVSSQLNAQQATARHRLLSPQLLQQKVAFKVSNDPAQVKDTTARVERVSSFRLKPGEEKAVAQTGQAISRVDKSVLQGMVDTSNSERVFMLPELYYAKESLTGLQIAYRILFIDAAPMRYDFAKKLFEGSIRFIPVEVSNTGTSQLGQKKLTDPEEILVSYGTVSKPLLIQSVNWPPMDISIQSAEALDSVEVKILTVSNPLGYPKKLGVEPAIVLSSVRSRIQGMGIQTIPVHISLKGVSGSKTIPVGVETSLGSLDSARVEVVGDHPGVVNLRSESVGDIEIKAINQNYRSNVLELHAVFPWLFLVLALLGGLIGALGKTMIGKKKVIFRPLALGSILGLIAAVAYWGLGIVLIGFSIETRGLNEAMVMGFGLLAGYFGIAGGNKSGAKG